MTDRPATTPVQKSVKLMEALFEWRDKIGKKRRGTFKAYENKLWDALNDLLLDDEK